MKYILFYVVRIFLRFIRKEQHHAVKNVGLVVFFFINATINCLVKSNLSCFCVVQWWDELNVVLVDAFLLRSVIDSDVVRGD